MKNFIRWITPFLIGVLGIGIVWVITDMESEVYIWKISSTALLERLYALIVVVVMYYIFHFFVTEKLIGYFTKESMKKVHAKEYLSVLFIAITLITGATIFVGHFINNHEATWTEIIRNCGLGVPLNFLVYMNIRSNRISEAYNRQALQIEKIRNNQLETELKYLRAQYHPHFLFNALNTVYFQIEEQNVNAKNTVELLSELLRYQLYNIEEKVNISEEINYIKSYILFQQLRMTKRLVINTCFDDALDKQKIYPLIYQPFLENAFKYVGGEYLINLKMEYDDKQVIFYIENSLPEQIQPEQKSNAGIGIENVRRRLALLYPDRHHLNIKQRDNSFFVELIINPDPDED